MSKTDQYLTWVEIDGNALKHNLSEIHRIALLNEFYMPSRDGNSEQKRHPLEILAVIKSDAYGHGIDYVSKILRDEGIEFFGVSNVFEGIHLRENGIKNNILIFENTLEKYLSNIGKHNLIPTVSDLKTAGELNNYAKDLGRNINIHVQIDTGMGRLGIWHEEALAFVEELFKYKYLTIHGIYTHFPVADKDPEFTEKQIDILHNIVVALDRKALIIPYIHAVNSMGLVGYNTQVLNLARPGLMFYGLYPDFKTKRANIIDLKPVMTVKSRIICIKDINKGRSISYGRTFTAKRDMRVAIIPIGYNDGYLRALSNKSSVLIGGKFCPVVGKVTMNQIIVDIALVKSASQGDEVVILGKQGDSTISADDLANYADTINYEIVCSLGNRLPRVYL